MCHIHCKCAMVLFRHRNYHFAFFLAFMGWANLRLWIFHVNKILILNLQPVILVRVSRTCAHITRLSSNLRWAVWMICSCNMVGFQVDSQLKKVGECGKWKWALGQILPSSIFELQYEIQQPKYGSLRIQDDHTPFYSGYIASQDQDED